MFALLALVLVSLAAVVAHSRAREDALREREAQLLWVGDQYRQAIRSYAAVRPVAGTGQYPKVLEDLVEDKRGPVAIHHLRRLYSDPMTGAVDWVLEGQAGAIVGLHSRSEQAPLRHANFPAVDAGFARAQSYAQWRFLVNDDPGRNATDLPPGAAAPSTIAGGPGATPGTAPGDGNGSSDPSAAPPAPSNTVAAELLCRDQQISAVADCNGLPQPQLNACIRAAKQQYYVCLAAVGN